MSKDFRGTDGQEKSCTQNRLKRLKEYESLESRLEHSQWATIYREFQMEGAVQRKAWSVKWVPVVGFCSNWSDWRTCRTAGNNSQHLTSYRCTASSTGCVDHGITDWWHKYWLNVTKLLSLRMEVNNDQTAKLVTRFQFVAVALSLR